MKIVFNHPPAKDSNGNDSLNPFMDFDPKNREHYPKGPGVYIYGLRLEIEGSMKFVPLYVGKHNTNVGKRVYEHYFQESMPGNSCKEIFNLTNLKTNDDLYVLYNAMKDYDEQRGKSLSRIRNNQLIWFNDKDFFDDYISRKSNTNGPFKISNYISGSGHLASLFPTLGDLDLISNKYKIYKKIIEDLRNSIIKTKLQYNENFYFIYSNVQMVDLVNINYYENSTKLALEKVGIYTTAASGKQSNLSLIDLDRINNHLVQL